nr:enoyl-CoA hydratase/isomerase family protein [Streptomyces sp. alain-838]
MTPGEYFAAAEGLSLRPDGLPDVAVRRLDLDAWHGAAPQRVAEVAERITEGLSLVLGIAHEPVPEALRPLLEASTVTLAPPGLHGDAPQVVTAAEPNTEWDRLADCVRRHPRAALMLGQLLRQTESLTAARGLAAEAAVYSTLLGGDEFAAWLGSRPAPRGARSAPEQSLVSARRLGDVLEVELRCPRRRNALSQRLRDDLYDALSVAVLDESVARIELSGTGPVFCSGGDLTEFGEAPDPVAAWLVRLQRAPWRLIDRLRERTTVRVHGAAVGAGIEMAAFAGRLVAAPGTRFWLPEVSMGLVPGAGGTVSVTRRIGRWRAAWMMLRGAPVDTGTALRWGLVDEVADRD